MLILGVISSRSVQHHALAAHFVNEVQTSSNIRRIERFFKEQRIDFGSLAEILLEMVVLPYKLDLVIDRTNWEFGNCPMNFLVLSVLVDGKHGIPLFWSVLSKKGTSNSSEQRDLIQKFVDIFGADRIQSLIADREFVGEKWLCFLYAHGIPFYIRMKQNRLVEWGEEEKSLAFFFQHLKAGERRLLYKETKGMKLTFAGTRSQAGELALIMTNQTSQKEANILKTYTRRWTIECLFRNTKSNGFNLESTHLTSPDKLEKLMAVIAVAAALCIRTGQWQEKIKPTLYKKTVNAPLYSTFRRGFDALRRWFTNLKNILTILYPLNSLQNKGL